MYRLKFTLKYLFKLIIKNPVKLGLISLFIIGVIFVRNIDDIPVKYEVVGQVEHADNTIYIVRLNYKGDDGELKYSSRSYVNEEPLEIDKNGFITEMEMQTSTGLIIFGLVVLLFIIVIASFTDEDDIGFAFSKIYREVKVSEVKRHNDVEHIYYVYRNKVIYVQDYKGDLYHVPKFDYYSLLDQISRYKQNPNLYEDYKGTKSEIRDKKIDSVVG